MVIAFDASVWDLLEGDKQLSTADIRRAVEQAAETPIRAELSDADFEDDVEASGDHSVEPGDV